MTTLIPEVMHEDLIPTGISGLDDILRGGFKRGSLIMLAGNPGTGKSVFATSFLASGIIDFDEPGIYVSFGENEKTLVENMTKHFGPRVNEALTSEKFKFLDFVVMSQIGLDAILRTILEQVQKMGAKRLVIDSYSAMAQSFEREEVRTVLHAVLGKTVRAAGCTTVVISEVPRGEDNFGVGVEEFVSDGVILLENREFDGRTIRQIQILKMRGTRLDQTKSIFSLERGFTVFLPARIKQTVNRKGFTEIPDEADRYSTGMRQLDEILTGGYEKGSTVLLEMGENVTSLECNMFTLPTIGNFLMHGKPVVDIPSIGVGLALSQALVMQGAPPEEIAKLLRLYVPKEHIGNLPKSPLIAPFDGDDLAGSLEKFASMIADLKENFSQASLYIEGIDTLYSSFGEENVVKILNSTISASRSHGNLNLIILRPGIPSPSIYQMLRSIADVHLKVAKEMGSLVFYGLKPWTGLYSVELDTVRGYPWPMLVPLV